LIGSLNWTWTWKTNHVYLLYVCVCNLLYFQCLFFSFVFWGGLCWEKQTCKLTTKSLQLSKLRNWNLYQMRFLCIQLFKLNIKIIFK
jgi:hypothetical protein